MVGAGLGAKGLPVFAQAVLSSAGWGVACASLGGLALLLGLPLNWRYIRASRSRAGICSRCTFWNDVATGLWLFSLLDYHHHLFFDFDKYEWGDHSLVRVTD
jgi:hypothetical protein